MRVRALLLALLVATAAPLAAQDASGLADAESVLSQMVEKYGVSGAEGPVRDAVRTMLPDWAEPTVDSAGNLWVSVGSGDPVVAFVAHLDEIGFRVTAIDADGTLELERRGGFFPSLYAWRPALAHGAKGSVPGIFMPGDSGRTTADLALGSRAAVEASGVTVGTTLTSPKSYQRLAGTRATGRSFDDRVGSTALVLAVRRLDREKLSHRVIFIWSVREEIGLEGAEVAADALGVSVHRVHAVDTFVSADGPLERTGYGMAPLGDGAVIRAVDNSNVAPRQLVDSLKALAARHNVPLQFGATSGGNDGSAFAPWGVPDVPIAWPLRYSHSPAEVTDLKDVEALARLVEVIAEEW
jgi:putative aminopeptidase FrvX